MDIKKMLPFLDGESKEKLVTAILNKKCSDIELIHVVPFLDKEQINNLYQKFLTKEYDIDIISLLPFLDEDSIEDLYNKVINKEITDIDETVILPFLSSDKVKKLFTEYLDKISQN